MQRGWPIGCWLKAPTDSDVLNIAPDTLRRSNAMRNLLRRRSVCTHAMVLAFDMKRRAKDMTDG